MAKASDSVDSSAYSSTVRKTMEHDPYTRIIYKDSDYIYCCEAVHSSDLALTDSVWKITRIDLSNKSTVIPEEYPNGSKSYAFAVTDLSTVQGYSYSLS